jgi:vancomycin permeability regulator SanA
MSRLRRHLASIWATRWLRRSILVAGTAAVALVGFVVAVNQVIVRSADDRRYVSVEAVPEREVAIVFGAGLFDGRPSPALADRLDGAIELYERGSVAHLLMSGDNSRPDYDEVSAMRDYAIERGVPAQAITRDYAGFDTYDTCYRARDIFGVDGAVLVTQDYHLARALYTCDQLGLDVVGLAVPDWQFRSGDLGYEYSSRDQVAYTVREWLARSKAFVDTNVLHPEPTHLGDPEGLTET